MKMKYAEGGEVDNQRNKEIAQAILQQLGGGNRLIMMVGAYNFVIIPNGVAFRIKNAKANVIKITLNALDLYNLEVGRVRGTTYKVVAKHDNIYNDMLKPLIEKSTGMYLSLYEKGGAMKNKMAKGGKTESKSVAVSKTISGNEINLFIDYCYGFYGKGGTYADELNGGLTKAQVKTAVMKYLDQLDSNPTWGGGDSLDRERVRLIFDKNYSLLKKGGKMAEGGSLEDNSAIFDRLKKGDKIHITYGSGISRSNEVTLLVRSKNLVGKGKSYESVKITFDNVANPSGVKYYAYKRKDDMVGFAIGNMAISNVVITKADKMAKGGVMQNKAVKQLEDAERIVYYRLQNDDGAKKKHEAVKKIVNTYGSAESKKTLASLGNRNWRDYSLNEPIGDKKLGEVLSNLKYSLKNDISKSSNKKMAKGGGVDDDKNFQFVIIVHSDLGDDTYTITATDGVQAVHEAKYMFKKENPQYKGSILTSVSDKYAKGGAVGYYKVEVNQYIPYKSDKGVSYYYVIDSNKNTINKNTGKIYRGKQMDNYKFSLKEDAQKFADKLNGKYSKGGAMAKGGAVGSSNGFNYTIGGL